MVISDTQTLVNRLAELASPEIANTSQRFFKTQKGQYGEGDHFYGIRTATLRAVAKQCKSMTIPKVFELLNHEYHETRMVAVFILVERYQKSKIDTDKQTIADLYIQHSQKVNNWDLVDSSAYKILGPQLHGKDTAVLYELAQSCNLWQRRIAIITTLYFIKQDDYADTLALAEILLHDKEDLMHKAVGWMLREIGNRNKSVEVAFLDKYHKTMPRTMLRYAIEKFTPQERQHYMKK
ncbi:DNA alkylation repair protein [Psychrosphaera sp. 1_MG-2023]|uniref:DNA alkylation repair protein n=1 Tax=Psychrosphaera sp. 1_MG-2023 TaxID=3062643 RepID=UPI0026E3E96A|nr:DNA alkylation repair protein [Psychrosphaera sp. 1_MG-2023]MDO6718996.1 DNA alkylation repair protein [Psychrosphaera sp. 1_MG-2023]